LQGKRSVVFFFLRIELGYWGLSLQSRPVIRITARFPFSPSHHLSVDFPANHVYINEFKRISNERLSNIKKYFPASADNGRNDPAA
jgi:hypothetical protein